MTKRRVRRLGLIAVMVVALILGWMAKDTWGTVLAALIIGAWIGYEFVRA